MKHYPQKGRQLRIYFSTQGNVSATYDLKMTVRRAVEATLDYEKIIRDCEVSVTFCDNDYIRELNSEYRNIDKETDVLSFPLNNDIEEDACDMPELPLGDIVLSLDKTEEQAEAYEHSFLREAAFLTVHSTLHLLGYDHVTSAEDEEDMCRRQKEIVESLGLD